ncbi:hypothetical protein SAMN05216379_14810 [Nitrosomonas eutropha]|uniref:hypothetical protein n=1 Tax=Nitrosomonas eutropha TaxID=916 RepID=UPI0008854BFA|nr:hypothetical protein [Nitrosomonas eutropha]SCX28815.1 hypothetical protein SAMN05216379_14810 [Nitrosomonas eutropha]
MLSPVNQSPDLIAAELGTLLAGGDVLNSENVRSAITHQLHALPGQIAHGVLFWWQNGSGRQYSQP